MTPQGEEYLESLGRLSAQYPLPRLHTHIATCGHPDRPVKARGLCAPCYSRQWREAHPDRAKAFVNRWAEAHREQRRAYFKARRAGSRATPRGRLGSLGRLNPVYPLLPREA